MCLHLLVFSDAFVCFELYLGSDTIDSYGQTLTCLMSPIFQCSNCVALRVICFDQFNTYLFLVISVDVFLFLSQFISVGFNLSFCAITFWDVISKKICSLIQKTFLLSLIICIFAIFSLFGFQDSEDDQKLLPLIFSIVICKQIWCKSLSLTD